MTFSTHAQDTNAQNATADQQFLFAYRLLQRNERGMAAEALDEYLVKHPNADRAGDARYYRALLYQQAGDAGSAVALLEDAPDPTLLPAWRLALLHAQALARAQQTVRAIAVMASIDLADLQESDQAQILFETGSLHQSRNNLPKAIQAFEQSAALNTPLQARAQLALGQTQIRFGLDDPALASLTQAAASDDQAIAPLAARLAGDHARTLGRWEAAQNRYTDALTRFPDSEHAGPAAIGAMTSATQRKQPATVAALYEAHRAKITAPQQPTADYLAGVAYSQLNQPENAVAALQQIQNLQAPFPPGDAVLLLLAQNHAALQQHLGTQQAVDQLASLFPRSPRRIEAAFLKAAAERATQDTAAGNQTLTALLDAELTTPQRTRALLQRAAALETLGQTKPAIDDYLAYFETNPVVADQPTASQKAAVLRLMHLAHLDQQWPLIIGLGSKWAKQYALDPATEEDLLYRLGAAAYAGSDPTAAVWAFDRLFDKYPKTARAPQAAFYQGLALRSLNDNANAVAALERSLATQQLTQDQSLQARRLLVLIYAADERDAEAAHHLRQIEQNAGPQALSIRDWLWLGQHEQANQRYPQAIACYENAANDAAIDPPLRAFALYQTALCHQALQAWAQSVPPLNDLIKLDAGYTLNAKRARAQALLEQGKLDPAFDAYRELWACRVSAIEAEAFYQAAWIHQQSQRPQEAVRLLLRLTLLYNEPGFSPWPQRGYLLLAQAYEATGEPVKAQQAIRELQAYYPNSPEAATGRSLFPQSPTPAQTPTPAAP